MPANNRPIYTSYTLRKIGEEIKRLRYLKRIKSRREFWRQLNAESPISLSTLTYLENGLGTTGYKNKPNKLNLLTLREVYRFLGAETSFDSLFKMEYREKRMIRVYLSQGEVFRLYKIAEFNANINDREVELFMELAGLKPRTIDYIMNSAILPREGEKSLPSYGIPEDELEVFAQACCESRWQCNKFVLRSFKKYSSWDALQKELAIIPNSNNC